MVRVHAEIFERIDIAGRDLGLLEHRVGIDEYPDRAFQMLFAQPRGAAQIVKRRGLAIERHQPLLGDAVHLVLGRVPIGPAIAQVEPLHHRLHEGDVVAAILDDALLPRIVRVGTRILDVPDVEPEPPQAEDVMQRLPGDPGDRDLTGKVQDEDGLRY